MASEAQQVTSDELDTNWTPVSYTAVYCLTTY
jgi:hypothetical protein